MAGAANRLDARQEIGPVPPVGRLLRGLADEDGSGIEGVGHRVFARASVEDVPTLETGERIRAASRADQIVSPAPGDDVVAAEGVDGLRLRTPGEYVGCLAQHDRSGQRDFTRVDLGMGVARGDAHHAD